jgi:phage terminase Nu1 subunit (DNA packaging protein)
MANAKRAPAGSRWPDVCSKSDLSVLLKLSMRTLTDLAATGVLVPAPKRGTFLTVPSVANYVEKLRTAAANRAEEQRNPLNDEKLLTERATRRLQELKLAQIEGEVLSLAEVSESWSGLALKFKAALLSLPVELRQDLPHLTAHDGEVMRKAVRQKLRDLAKEVEDSVIAADAKDLRRA